MVTRKTRVLSAFAALLMLVSLFTCFVLPASAAVTLDPNAPVEWPADWPDNMIAYKNRTKNDTATDYAITDAADWFSAVLDSNSQAGGALNKSTGTKAYRTMEGITLWLTNDIDFSSFNGKITASNDKYDEFILGCRSNATQCFMGTINGQGYAFKNFVVDFTYEMSNGNYDNLAIIGCGTGATVRDFTVDASCSFTYRTSIKPSSDSANPTKTAEHYPAVVMAFNPGSKPNTFINVRNYANLDYYDLNDGTVVCKYNDTTNGVDYTGQLIPNKANSISVFGRQSAGVTLVNCFNAGNITNHDTARAVGLVEWMSLKKNNTFINCFNVGKLTTASSNEYYIGLFSRSGDALSATFTSKNVYAVGHDVGAAGSAVNATYMDDYGTKLEAGTAATGELAYLLNKNYAAYTGVDRMYYTTQNGTANFGTADNATVKVALDFYGVEYATYANVGEVVDLDALHQETIDGYEFAAGDSATGSIADGKLTISAFPNDSVVNINMVSAGLQLQGLKDKVAEIKADGSDNYSGDSYDGTLEEFLAELEEKIADSESDPKGPKAYANNAEVQADLAMLEEYILNDIVSVDLIAKYPDKVGYTVSNKAEMDILAENYTALSMDQTIYIAADIDMQGSEATPNAAMPGLTASIDGRNHTIKNYYLNEPLLGVYLGKEVKNLTFKDSIATTTADDGAFLISKIATGTTTKLSNLTMDGVVSKSSHATGGRQGLIVSQLSGGTLTFEDIVVVNSTMTRGASKEYLNSGLVLGKTYGGTLFADGLYLDNNTINGDRPSGTGRGIVMGEILCTAEVKNVLVTNTHVAEGQVNGIIGVIKEHGTNYVVNPVMTYENIISYNNGYTGCFTRPNASDDSSITFKNIYTDAEAFLSSEDYNGYIVEESCITNAGEAIASGEAAWALNAVLAGDKWTMVDGKPAFGTEDNQTVRVVVEMADFDTEYAYVNLDAEATLVHTVPTAVFSLKNAADSSFAAINGNKLTFTGVPTENLTLVITATSGELYFDALDAKIAEVEAKKTFYMDAEGTKTVEADLTAIKERRATEYNGLTQKDIQDDLALLESYVLVEVDADAKAILEAAKAELEAFGENISYFEQAELMRETLASITDVLNYDAPENGFEALEITATIRTAIESYNAIGERTIAEGKVVPLKLYELFRSYTNDWTVADEEDWRAGVNGIIGNTQSEGMTITLLNDIDMTADGDDSAVLPLAYTKYFNGVLDGQGHVFKNLKIDITVTDPDIPYEQLWAGLVCALGKTGVVKNLGVESGSITVTSGRSQAARVGSIVGNAGNGSVIQNCWNAASVSYKIVESGRADSYAGGIVGSATAWSTIDGCYNIGAVTSDGDHAAGINGWGQGDLNYPHGRTYNSFNYGTVTAKNGEGFIGAVRLGASACGGVANSYAIGTKLAFVATPENELSDKQKTIFTYNNDSNSELPAEIYATGELAWKLNSGWTEGYSNHTMDFVDSDAGYPLFVDYEEIHPFYTMKDGKTVFGTEENQTVRVTIKHDGIENYIYVNADEYVDLGETGTYVLESGAAEIIDGRYLNIDAAGDIVVTVTIPGIVEGNHAHADRMGYTNNNDGTHTPYCDYEVTIDGRTFTCDYAEEAVACSAFTYAVDQASIDADTHAHQSVATCTACGYNAPAADCAAGFTEKETATPDCVTPGELTFTCKNNCGYSYTERIPENGHKEIYTPAGNNQHTVTCENCTGLNNLVDCTPDENGWNETFAPSVNEFGTKETTCTVCGGTVTEQIAKLTAAMVTAGINEEETEVTATVALLNNPGLDSVTVKVAFDYTIMDLKEVVAENGLTVGTPTVENGVVTFTVTGEIEGDLNVAVATFTMKTEEGELVAASRDYKLKVTATAGEKELEGSEDIFTVTKGKDIVKGDMTGDKAIDLSDAILLIRYVSGTNLPEGYEGLITDAMADLTDEGDGVDLGDGQITPEVNTNDVLHLLRYLNGWTDVL